jgi:tRNA (Thr-GGU) A37 N-methylase
VTSSLDETVPTKATILKEYEEMSEIKFKPIGVLHTQRSDGEIREKGDVEGELEIYPEFQEGLEGIDGYSHLFVLVYLHRLRPEQIGG